MRISMHGHKYYGKNVCNSLFAITVALQKVVFSCQFEVPWLLCYGRLFPKEDNVMHVHTFCWLRLLLSDGLQKSDHRWQSLVDLLALVWGKLSVDVTQ